jgi:hypothetical protein
MSILITGSSSAITALYKSDPPFIKSHGDDVLFFDKPSGYMQIKNPALLSLSQTTRGLFNEHACD